jgi:hypothetical protein
MKLGNLGVDLSKIKKGKLSKKWQETIRKLDEHGAKVAPELDRKAAQAMREANKAWEEGNWVGPE